MSIKIMNSSEARYHQGSAMSRKEEQTLFSASVASYTVIHKTI